jgi:hypothetical protein
MASLTGNQINNSYQGLLKTENNAAITGGMNLTDGLGNLSGLFIGTSLGEAGVTGANPKSLLKNSNFNATTYPMGSGSTQLEFQDVNGLQTGDILQDFYGGMYYTNKYGDQGEQHIFRSKDANNVTVDSRISMTTYNAVNNSDNWFIGYNERITAGSFDNGTRNLTLTKPSGTDIVVNIPGGGGGSAGLINGAYTDSLISASSLTTNPAEALGIGDFAVGNGAKVFTNTTNNYYAGGSIALGDGATVEKTSDLSFAIPAPSIAIGKGATAKTGSTIATLAIGQNSIADNEGATAIGNLAQANFTKALAIGYDSRGNQQLTTAIGNAANASGYSATSIGASSAASGGGFLTGSTSIGVSSSSQASRSVAIGAGAKLNNSSFNGAVIVGSFDASAAGSFGNGVILGGGNGSFSSNYQANDLIAIGGSITFSGIGSNNTIIAGLVAETDGADDSVGLGRQCYIGAASTTAIGRNSRAEQPSSTAIGPFSQATASSAVAIGDSVVANKQSTVSVTELETQLAGGGITMKSPNGTEYKLTVSDAGALVIT